MTATLTHAHALHLLAQLCVAGRAPLIALRCARRAGGHAAHQAAHAAPRLALARRRLLLLVFPHGTSQDDRRVIAELAVGASLGDRSVFASERDAPRSSAVSFGSLVHRRNGRCLARALTRRACTGLPFSDLSLAPSAPDCARFSLHPPSCSPAALPYERLRPRSMLFTSTRTYQGARSRSRCPRSRDDPPPSCDPETGGA